MKSIVVKSGKTGSGKTLFAAPLKAFRNFFIAFAIGVIFLEILLRAFNPLGINYLPRLRELSKLYRYEMLDGQWRCLFLPNASVTIGGIEYSINEHGLRDRALSAQKGEREKRIIFLGDSMVFGLGVKGEDLFAVQAERLLNKNKQGIQFRIIPAAVPGYNSEEENVLLKRVGDPLKADALVLFLNNNDLNLHDETPVQKSGEIHPAFGLMGEKLLLKIKETHVAALLFFIRKKYFREGFIRDEGMVTASIQKMKDWASERNIPMAVISFGSMPFAQKYCENKGISFLNMNVGEENKRKFRLSPVDEHYDSEGHRWVAERSLHFLQGFLGEAVLNQA